jgi:hypothetical protein
MARILLSLSVLFLTLSAVFGVLNTNKARELRGIAERSNLERTEAEQLRLAKEKEIAAREAALAKTKTGSAPAPADNRIATAEAQLIKAQSEKAELQARLQAQQREIAELQQRAQEPAAKELIPDVLPMPGTGDLQTELEETRRQLDEAEREKQRLADRIRTTPARAGTSRSSTTAVIEQPRRRVASAPRPDVRGTVLAVNQAYNFVVLNLGGRQGIEANTEMLVLRGGTLIGKIRVSSVEPATAIGDIITNSLARGVQVQPGDIVIYAGSNS